ncbi:hypothetical protein ACS0TY_031614 [Phlomoides rotata]
MGLQLPGSRERRDTVYTTYTRDSEGSVTVVRRKPRVVVPIHRGILHWNRIGDLSPNIYLELKKNQERKEKLSFQAEVLQHKDYCIKTPQNINMAELVGCIVVNHEQLLQAEVDTMKDKKRKKKKRNNNVLPFGDINF